VRKVRARRGILPVILAAASMCVMSADAPAADFTKQAAKLLRAIHPSYLGAIGTGEELARNWPTISQRLHQTRDAINALGDGYLAPPGRVDRDDPLKVIIDPIDRRRLVKYLEQLEYLTGLVQTAWTDAEGIEFVRAVEKKMDDINHLYVRYTGERVLAQPDSPPGPGECTKKKQGVEWVSASMAFDGRPAGGGPWACTAGAKICWMCPEGFTWGLGKPHEAITVGKAVQCGRQVLVSDCP
jgi:hypothetical protein